MGMCTTASITRWAGLASWLIRVNALNYKSVNRAAALIFENTAFQPMCSIVVNSR